MDCQRFMTISKWVGHIVSVSCWFERVGIIRCHYEIRAKHCINASCFLRFYASGKTQYQGECGGVHTECQCLMSMLKECIRRVSGKKEAHYQFHCKEGITVFYSFMSLRMEDIVIFNVLCQCKRQA